MFPRGQRADPRVRRGDPSVETHPEGARSRGASWGGRGPLASCLPMAALGLWPLWFLVHVLLTLALLFSYDLRRVTEVARYRRGLQRQCSDSDHLGHLFHPRQSSVSAESLRGPRQNRNDSLEHSAARHGSPIITLCWNTSAV